MVDEATMIPVIDSISLVDQVGTPVTITPLHNLTSPVQLEDPQGLVSKWFNQENNGQHEHSLQEGDKQVIDSSLAILNVTKNPKEAKNEHRIKAIEAIISYGDKVLPYLKEKLLADRRLGELGQFINNLAKEEDVFFILETLPDLAGNENAAELVSRTLIRIVYDIQFDYDNYDVATSRREVLGNLVFEFLKNNPKIDPKVRFNCLTALACSRTNEEYLSNFHFQQGANYISEIELVNRSLNGQEDLTARYDFFPEVNDTQNQQEEDEDFDLSINEFNLNPSDGNTILLEEEYPREKWEEHLRRLIRRRAINKNLSETSLTKIKEAVRLFEKKIDVDELINSLVKNEFTISPRIAEVAQEVSKIVLAKYPKVKAILLIGSSIHGGALIREATKASENPDFDFGVLSDEELSQEESQNIVKYVEKFLPKIAGQYELHNGFYACSNPEEDNTTSLKNVKHFMDFAYYINESSFTDRILRYLQPSFPPEVNEKNREIVKAGLKELHIVDEEKYKHLVNSITQKWLDIHLLKEKHFGIPELKSEDQTELRKRDVSLVKKVTAASAEKMSEPMNKLLHSTTLNLSVK